MGHVLHHVLQGLGPVGAAGQGVEHGADFALAGGRHFVVEHFDRDADLFEGQHHGGTDVLQGIDRRNREVAALDAGTVAGVAGFGLLLGGPGGFFGTQGHVATGHVGMPGHGIENEEFGLGTEVGGVADAGGLEIGFCAARNGTRVAVIAFAVGRLDDVAGQHQGGLVEERVHEGGVRIGFQQHVGSLDAFPAGNGRTIEGVAVFEPLFGHNARGDGNVLLLALGVGKAQVNEFGFVVLDHFQYIGDRHGSALLRINRI